MIGVSVASTAEQFTAAVTELKDRDMKRAVAVALNRTAAGVQVEASRKIRETYNVSARELRRAFSIKKAWGGNLVATVRASGKALNVIGFGARKTAKGVSFAIKKGSRKRIDGAFIATINGYEGVWMRKKKEDGKLYPRLPIKAVTTVSVPGMFSTKEVEAALQTVSKSRFERELRASLRAAVLKQSLSDTSE